MIVKNTICFLVVIALASALRPIPKPESFLAKDFAVPRPSRVVFHIDDEFMNFFVNGNKLTPQFSDEVGKAWNKEKRMEVVLYPGDIVTISGVNNGGLAGMIGVIEFYDSEENKYVYSTNETWLCDGKEAMITSTNDQNTQSLIRVSYLIPKSAKFIWSSHTPDYKEVRCSFKIPIED